MSINNQINVYLFDIDGVLLDTECEFNKYWVKAALELGYSLTPEMALELRSLDSKLANKLFMKWFGDRDAYAYVRAKRKELMSGCGVHNSRIKEGAVDFLRYLKSNNMKTAVVSSSPQERVINNLNNYDLVRYFDYVISASSVENNKPYKDIYEFAIKQTGYLPEECACIEDSPNGLMSARAAGCYTIMIPDLSPYQEKLSDIVDLHVNNFNELLTLLCSNNGSLPL